MRLVLTAVLALALATGTAVSGAVVPGGTAAAAVPRGARTTVVLTVSGCDGCTISPSSSLDDGRLWQAPAVEVRKGRARFTMPTRRTRGLRLALSAPDRKSVV